MKDCRVDMAQLEALSRLARSLVFRSTTYTKSGHPSSCSSAVELIVCLLFGREFRYYPDKPDHEDNDGLIFSGGHLAPLFYTIWALVKGSLIEPDEVLQTLRKFGSRLEGHPTRRFPYTIAATGSLGFGLPIGVGRAIYDKYIRKGTNRTYVLMGDSEMAEGSVWEAIQLAAYYNLSNLVGILNMNRLGQRGETMYGRNAEAYADRVSAFGWDVICIDGHDLEAILQAYFVSRMRCKPTMIIADTVKGKGVSFVEYKNGWHGKPLTPEELAVALREIGDVDESLRGEIAPPDPHDPIAEAAHLPDIQLPHPSGMIATREAYGRALAWLVRDNDMITVSDAEVKNSTYANLPEKVRPDRFWEMFLTEQSMIGVAQGLASRGMIPFCSTFAVFISRAYDAIRMAGVDGSNIKLCGSHCGVSVGPDGSSHMAIEDIAIMRAVRDSVILYPADASSTAAMVRLALGHQGLVYLRTTRSALPELPADNHEFRIGGCRVVREEFDATITLIGAGVTVHEALKAAAQLRQEGILARVIDLYSIKPIDPEAVWEILRFTPNIREIIVVEDHAPEGGISEAVMSALVGFYGVPRIHTLAVSKPTGSGTPEELAAHEEIDAAAIAKKARAVLRL